MTSLDTAREFGVCTGGFPFEEVRGKTILFTGWIKTKNVKKGYAGLWWRVDGKEREILGFDNMHKRGVKGTTDWQKVSIEMKVDSRATRMNFGVLFPGVGTAWFDHLEIFVDGVRYQDEIQPATAAPDMNYLKRISKADSAVLVNADAQAEKFFLEAFAGWGGKGQPIDKYSLSQVWARLGKTDSAFAMLDKLLRRREFTNYEGLLKDTSFFRLKEDAKWQVLGDLIRLLQYKPPPGWQPGGGSPGKYAIGLEKAAGRSGSAAATIISLDSAGITWAKLGQKFKAYKYLGKRIKVTGYLKTLNVKGWAALSVRADEEGTGRMTYYDNMHDGNTDRSLKGTSDWTKCELVIDVPTSTGYIGISALVSGTGQIWFDDLTVEIVDFSVPVTGRGMNYSLEPVNLDFEKY